MVFCNLLTDFLNLYQSVVTILILIDGFLQCDNNISHDDTRFNVTILILIDGFLQSKDEIEKLKETIVTILILIDGFLQ